MAPTPMGAMAQSGTRANSLREETISLAPNHLLSETKLSITRNKNIGHQRRTHFQPRNHPPSATKNPYTRRKNSHLVFTGVLIFCVDAAYQGQTHFGTTLLTKVIPTSGRRRQFGKLLHRLSGNELISQASS